MDQVRPVMEVHSGSGITLGCFEMQSTERRSGEDLYSEIASLRRRVEILDAAIPEFRELQSLYDRVRVYESDALEMRNHVTSLSDISDRRFSAIAGILGGAQAEADSLKSQEDSTRAFANALRLDTIEFMRHADDAFITHRNQIDNISVDIQTITDAASVLRSDISGLTETLNRNSGEISSLSSKIASLFEMLNIYRGDVSEIREYTAGLMRRISAQDEAIIGLLDADRSRLWNRFKRWLSKWFT